MHTSKRRCSHAAQTVWPIRLLMACVPLFNACGETVAATGVVTATLDVVRERVGAAPADISAHELFEDTLRRVKLADVVGDEADETLIDLPLGKGVEIRAGASVIDRILTDEYLTDFGAVPIDGRPKNQLVLYTYPNSTRGGTFRIVTLDGRELVSWTEQPPPGRFVVAKWNGVDTIFYLQNDELVLRSSSGATLGRLPLPSGSKFRDLHIAETANGRLIVLASGNGYTPFHTVCIYSSVGELVFQEIRAEHGFELDADAHRSDFFVYTRSSKWHFFPRTG